MQLFTCLLPPTRENPRNLRFQFGLIWCRLGTFYSRLGKLWYLNYPKNLFSAQKRKKTKQTQFPSWQNDSADKRRLILQII
jgi:hypothetical protein